MYDLVIIGGGPGGIAAGIYAARKKINAALVAESFGGQSITSADIQNWVGTKSISGFELARNLEDHLRSQSGIEIIDGDAVEKVSEIPGGFSVSTRQGKTLETKYIIVASGSRRRKLDIPGEKELDGRGVAYCSTCDAPIFQGKEVAVIGGGNAGLEAAVDLLPYASRISLLEFGEQPKGDPATLEKIRENPKFQLITMAQTTEVLGKEFVSGLRYIDRRTGEAKELPAQGVFVEIGSVPNTDFVKDLVDLTPAGEIAVDHKTQATSHPGIWAVGDVSDVLYKQNNISVGDGVKAILNIYETLSKQETARV